jgi:hypothetical protein
VSAVVIDRAQPNAGEVVALFAAAYGPPAQVDGLDVWRLPPA